MKGQVVSNFRGRKIVVFKMKRRKGYRRKQGHRQEQTVVKITDISTGGKAKPAKKKAAAKAVEPAEATPENKD